MHERYDLRHFIRLVKYKLVSDFREPLKIQSSPKCKAWKKFRSAAYDLYVSKKFFTQRSSWDEIWIFRDVLYFPLRTI